MATILVYTTPARGHLYPLVPVLEELRGRGHTIVLRTLASEVERARSLGFDAAPIAPEVEAVALDDYLGGSALASEKRAVRVFCRRAPADARDLRAAIDAVRPDGVLVDINAWGAMAAAEAWSGRWAVYCPYPLPLPSKGSPPYGPGLAPARGPAGRVRDALLRPLVFGAVERIVVPRMNEVRRAVGLPPVRSSAQAFTAPPLLLYLTAEPFEYPHPDWPESIRMVGACNWDPPSEPPAWLRAIDRPIVLVTTSSEFQDDGALVRCALEALAREPVHVVATLPSMDPAGFPAPDNAHVLPFTPHAPVLERAACAVTHAGMGATQKALARGVPVVAVPFGRDQLEVARRVEVAGAGARLPAARLTPDRLRTKVREAMRMAAGARRVAEGYAAAGGPRRAAELLEELVGARPKAAAARPAAQPRAPA